MPKFNRLIDGQKDESDANGRGPPSAQKDAIITGMRTVLESLSDSSWWLLNDLCE